MNAEKVLILFGDELNLAHKFHNKHLRFLGEIIAFLIMTWTFSIWSFIAVYVGFMDTWRNSWILFGC